MSVSRELAVLLVVAAVISSVLAGARIGGGEFTPALTGVWIQ